MNVMRFKGALLTIVVMVLLLGGESSFAQQTWGGIGNNTGRNQGRGPGANSSPRVQRSAPVRARLVPRFSAPRIAPAAVSTRVNQRLSSLPATRRFAGSMNVSVQGRTAFVNGSRLSSSQMSRVSRQLRLEPGIRRVVNRNSFGR